jgi:hypothetical protein
MEARDLKNYHLSDYQYIQGGRSASCTICGKGISHLFHVTDGENKAILGSECVRKIGIKRGAESLPTKARGMVERKTLAERRNEAMGYLDSLPY